MLLLAWTWPGRGTRQPAWGAQIWEEDLSPSALAGGLRREYVDQMGELEGIGSKAGEGVQHDPLGGSGVQEVGRGEK